MREVGLIGVAALNLELLVLAAEVDEDVGQAAVGYTQIRQPRNRVEQSARRRQTACRGRYYGRIDATKGSIKKRARKRIFACRSQDNGFGDVIDSDVVNERIELLVRQGRAGIDVGRKEHALDRQVGVLRKRPRVGVVPPAGWEHEIGRAETEDAQEILTVGGRTEATELMDVLNKVVGRKESCQRGSVRRWSFRA